MASDFIHADEQDESQIQKNRLSDIKAFISLWDFALGQRMGLAIAIGIIFLGAISSIISARTIGDLVEHGLIAKNYHRAWQFAGVVLVFSLLGIGLSWVGRRRLATNAEQIILNVRKRLFDHIQLLPMSFYDHQPQGRIVTRITHDVEGIEEFFSSSLGMFIMSVLRIFIAVVAMLVTHWKLGVILILSMIPPVSFIFIMRNRTKMAMRKNSKNSSAINARLSEYINGMEVIRTHGLEEWSAKMYNHKVLAFVNSTLDANLLFAWTRPLTIYFCSLPLVMLVWFGGKAVLAGAITVGVFVSYLKYSENFINPIMNIARDFHLVLQAFTNAERITSFLSAQREEVALGPDGVLSSFAMKGEIKINALSMEYEKGVPVLSNIDLEIAAGQTVGFVGTTGCGKTSTVSLLTRLYEFQQGQILIDGVDIRLFNRNFLRSKIGFVSQDVTIFRGSLRTNLVVGGIRSDEAILAACQHTGLWGVMQKNRLTLNSLILEDGVNLSTGEKQLVALTRVLLNDPQILILDEATANIDPGYEKIIQEAVNLLMKDRTCIIIAHRLDTLKHCERIFVFDKGRVVEQGSLLDLSTKEGGSFYKLKQAQTPSQLVSPIRPVLV
ncbi:MAG: hypothetical protein A2504_17485 [Bdellovibrionales bacterium RIFOXYD12_FULL_39_22]|nr:MAG: hypothetical protein A2385_10475 [Bdellovibrionales bacterium RIFOXYB1_FULL_39_21]OFZ40795.1 MAG: hypothetical protein A2485_17255 [Bdellovibrionales bacterium RIFOXYC12_FULL_39_17]OFZ48217.1 MAG: hypothetical protein A2404_17415 [Bdellovibrionales bacterium RIFOXYC1_FULL_39_130]OFZ75867.1 MAG: hypothetical protein A2560_13915 [Bdellovibrionales bacterium RIFOXYD1_FULL_39_84]OFZ75888.1 MAG: hypothetical protein A2451_02335 [Bdellovibrionales bacterium RIFOXYC2_FULL_39_8]OFZ91928.1 MAG: